MEKQHFVPGDPVLMENIVSYLKAKGIFDEFRHECLADVDTKSSCQNLSQRIDGYATKFLSNETWNPELNKNELRNKLRKHIDESGMLAIGADHVVEQVINPKIQQFFLPRIIEVVHQYLNENIEKRNRKHESLNEAATEKALDNLDKPKTTVLDPIADILSFAYSKPKPSGQTAVKAEKKKEETANFAKIFDVSKLDKKKEDNTSLSKGFDIKPKVEKKKEENVLPSKGLDNVPKVEKKKEDHTSLLRGLDITPKVEKKKDENSLSKSWVITPKVENIKEEIISSPKVEYISTEIEKEDKYQRGTVELKLENKDNIVSELTFLASLEAKEEEISDEDMALDDSSLESEDKVMYGTLKIELDESINEDSLSEEEQELASLETNHTPELEEDESESSSDSQTKVDENPYNPNPIASLSSQCEENLKTSFQSSSRPSGLGKSKSRADKLKKSSFLSSMNTICKPDESQISTTAESSDGSSSDKNKAAMEGPFSLKVKTSSKLENEDNTGFKSKSRDAASKLPSELPKLSSVKKESNQMRLKHKSSKYSKSSTKPLTEASTSSGNGSKASSQYSSSYESSDQEKGSTSSSQEKQKHFSKHSQKQHSDTSGIKRQGSEPDNGTPKRHKDGEDKHSSLVKHKKSIAFQDSVKISSRSNSFGSTSDSQTSYKETADETSDGSSKKSSDRLKKTSGKDKDPCGGGPSLPPPPPPPPPSSGITTTSTELSSIDEPSTQSSDDSNISNSDVDISSESDVEMPESPSAARAISPKFLKEPELLNDIYDIFLFSSSSSDFEGYSSSPEQESKEYLSDVSVSTVHTSDLSSFEDELSEVEYAEDDEREKQVKKLTIKQAKEILQAKVDSRKAKKLKNKSPLKQENLHVSFIETSPFKAASQEETSPSSEPKRESRRERKLNPKYASSEYTSIFNSKRTSFITKQTTHSDEKQTPPKTDSKKASDNDSPLKTDSPPIKLRISGLKSLNEAQSSQILPDVSSPAPQKDLETSKSKKSSPESTSKEPSDASLPNHHDKNHNMLGESETQNRIALKDKKSAFKNDNETNKDPNSHGAKRKFEEEEAEKNSNKRICRKSLVNSCSSESVANENEPLNKTPKNSSPPVVLETTNIKNFIHKQKVNNNGDVMNKVERVRRNSHSKPNHVNDKAASE